MHVLSHPHTSPHMQHSELTTELLIVAVGQLFFPGNVNITSDYFHPQCMCVCVTLCVCTEKTSCKAVIMLRSNVCECICVDYFPESSCLHCRRCSITVACLWLHTPLVSGRQFITGRCVIVCGSELYVGLHVRLCLISCLPDYVRIV